jgi:hypothetical protein
MALIPRIDLTYLGPGLSGFQAGLLGLWGPRRLGRRRLEIIEIDFFYSPMTLRVRIFLRWYNSSSSS